MHRLPLLVAALAAPCWAGVSGHVSAQGQALGISSTDPRGGAQAAGSLMLQESIGLHYSGMPFGRNVALITAGLEAANANSWGSGGVAMSGRTASLDLSVGLFPRRALPLRLYARGTVSDGGPSVITLGGRESLLYGLSFNLDPGKRLPGLRFEAQEHRFTGFGAAEPLSDLTRTLSAGVYKAVGEHQLNLNAQYRLDSRAALGDFSSVLLNGAWTSPRHQSGVVFSQADRNLAVPGFGATGRATDRQVRLSHAQRWLPLLATDANVRLVDSRFADGSGTQVGLGLGGTWKPLEAHELLLSASGDAGLTVSRGPQGVANGAVAGGGGRVGYARPVWRLVLGGAVGANGTFCDCIGVGQATRSSVEGALTAASLDFEKVDLRADYTVAVVTAPQVLGGSRVEHHARLQTQARFPRATGLFTLGYDDGVRDFVDVATNTVLPFQERVFVGVLGGLAPVGKGSVSAELRHARGASFAPQTPFVNAPLPSARAVTNVSVDGFYPLLPRLEARGGLLANWTVLTGSQTLFTAGVQAALSAQVGRITATVSYQYLRTDVSGLASNQHIARLFLTRPFTL